jgi:hypothetical protein
MENYQDYAASICGRRPSAVVVPFVEVSPDGWKPEVRKCHANVRRWIEANPGRRAVHGWIVDASFGSAGVRLAAHSVVRNLDGSLIDITPVENGQPRGGAFVEHQGDSATFFQMVAANGQCLICSSLDPEADAAELQAMLDDLDAPKNGQRFGKKLVQIRAGFVDLPQETLRDVLDEAVSSARKPK